MTTDRPSDRLVTEQECEEILRLERLLESMPIECLPWEAGDHLRGAWVVTNANSTIIARGLTESEAKAIAAAPALVRQLRAATERAVAAEGANAEQEYRGNSVGHWWAKASAYGNIVHGCTPALERAGYADELRNSDVAGGIARAVEKLVGRVEAATERAERAEAEIVRLRKRADDADRGTDTWTDLLLSRSPHHDDD